MRCKAPDIAFFADLRDLNAECLALIRGHRPTTSPRVLGLEAGVVTQIRGLSPVEIDFVAATPCLLAGFTALPTAKTVSEAGSLPTLQDRTWYETARVFAATLMTYLRQVAREDRLTIALCVGPRRAVAAELAALPLTQIPARAALAVSGLEARFADNPRFWPDLLRAACSGDREARVLACLTSIPLCLSGPVIRRTSGS